MALRRWKPFLASFDHIDDAIDSAARAVGGVPRGEFKSARNRIVEALCCVTDDAVAEGICRLLDDAMAESLVTLRTAGTQVELLASGELVAAIGALARGHWSGRVRGLARDVVRGWRAAVEAEVGTAIAAMQALDAANGHGNGHDAEGMKPTTCPRKMLPPVAVGGGRVTAAKIAEPNKMPLVICRGCSVMTVASKKAPAPQAKTTSPAGACRLPSSSCGSVEDTKQMEATKRKLHAGYREAEDAKRRCTVQVVVAPDMLWRRTTLPAVKAPACSAAETTRRSNAASLLRRV